MVKSVALDNKFNTYSYDGFIDDMIKLIQTNQLLKTDLWKRFVDQFRQDDADFEGGWRGEFWGKMMRGASLVYQYTLNDNLYEILTASVKDILSTQDSLGRISTYDVSHEFDAWDMWCRKYVLLGLLYYLDICKDDKLKDDIVKSMRLHLDYIISKIGHEKGKKEITKCTRHWRGLNSSSILEPVVKLYNITKEKKYFDFAKYIVDIGCTDVQNIFDLAYENKLNPYQYPVTKAYEMTSCFEGLLEFYKITKIKKYKTAIINFANKILKYDFTVIGSCGCTHELFDHSKVRQANTTNTKIAQETCVTVTLMDFFKRVFMLTNDPKFADAFETSMYNAYLGSINTDSSFEDFTLKAENIPTPEAIKEPLMFDAYSPLTAGRRGYGIGGLKIMSDKHYYGCCACIGSLGAGLIPQMHLINTDNALIMNLYINGKVNLKTPLGNSVVFDTLTQYPKNESVQITLNLTKDEEFEIWLRNPSWSDKTSIKVNGNKLNATNGYIKIKRLWKNEDIIELDFDMTTKVIYPQKYKPQILMNEVIWGHNYIVPKYDKQDPKALYHIALRRGPLMLCAENRLGYSVDDALDIKTPDKLTVNAKLTDDKIAYKSIVTLKVPLENGKDIYMTDYASAGKLWTDESKMAVWIRTNHKKGE